MQEFKALQLNCQLEDRSHACILLQMYPYGHLPAFPVSLADHHLYSSGLDMVGHPLLNHVTCMHVGKV